MKLSTFDAFKRLKPDAAVPVEGERLKALQTCLAAILDDIALVCEAEGVDWALGGGSALGALRHQGFVPWDDDLDVNMPRTDWRRFREAFERRFGERYVVYEPGAPRDYPLAFPRIRLRGSRYVTREDLLFPELEAGAFVDVFMLEGTFDLAVARFAHGLGSLALGFLYSCRKQFFERRLLRQWGLTGGAFRLKRAIGFCLAWGSLGFWTRTWDRWNACCRRPTTRYVTFPVGRRHFFGELALRDGMRGGRWLPFEGRRVRCVRALEAYMERLYGAAYLTPPPPERRERHAVFGPLLLPGDRSKC